MAAALHLVFIPDSLPKGEGEGESGMHTEGQYEQQIAFLPYICLGGCIMRFILL